jgi:hypothetical protein
MQDDIAVEIDWKWPYKKYTNGLRALKKFFHYVTL